MKKNLIALAVLAASGVASAQSTLTLYGLADVYLGSTKEKTTVGGASTSLRQTVIDSGGFNTSRFGMKGSEDLGGGLKANFLLEGGFDISTGAANNYVSPYNFVAPTAANPDGLVQSNAIFGRQSWVGLSGGFGEIRLGKMWTPYDEVKGSGAGAFDANIFAPANAIWLSNTYQDRPGNAIYYATPNFSGFSAAGMYSFGENKGANVKAGEIGSVNVQYGDGPVALALAYQIERQGSLTGQNPNKLKFTQLNGSYDFQVVKLLTAYGNVKNGNAKANEYQIGVDVPLGAALTVSAGVARSKVTGVGADIKSTAFGLAARYELSKRTFLYTGLQLAKSEITGVESKTDTFATGVQHKF
jgi:predicted porin